MSTTARRNASRRSAASSRIRRSGATPERAQELGRERARLSGELAELDRTSHAVSDAGAAARAGRARERRVRGARHRARRRRSSRPACASSSSSACSAARWIRTAPSWTSRPAPAAPRRRTGPRCCCACTCAGARAHGFGVRGHRLEVPAKWPASRAPRCRCRASTPTAGCAPRPACTAWCASRRSIPATAATPRSPRCSSRRKSTRTSTSRSIRRT